ncbi:hypothetical protein RFI_11393, partial [Reticulomyxa filosa]
MRVSLLSERSKGNESNVADIVEVTTLSEFVWLDEHMRARTNTTPAAAAMGKKGQVYCTVSQVCVCIREYEPEDKSKNKSQRNWLKTNYATFVEWFGSTTPAKDKAKDKDNDQEIDLLKCLETCSSWNDNNMIGVNVDMDMSIGMGIGIGIGIGMELDLVHDLFHELFYRRELVQVWMICCSGYPSPALSLSPESRLEWAKLLQMSNKWKHLFPVDPSALAIQSSPLLVLPYEILSFQWRCQVKKDKATKEDKKYNDQVKLLQQEVLLLKQSIKQLGLE